ncbi:MAG: hypothetical protein FWG41_01610 [Methanomassiliicoccaceae archaeon]|nr:hypothetical protein [Methanomassiliicoccaceae archaeon]
MRFDRNGISSIVAVLVVVLLVGVSAGGAYVLLSDDESKNGDSKDRTTGVNEPVIQGKMGMGSTFFYESIPDETTDSPGTYVEIKAEIVGQSGSYYVLYFSWIHQRSYGAGTYQQTSQSQSFGLFMVHKLTGEVMFSSKTGTESVEYNGKNVSVNKWETILNDFFGQSNVSLMTSSQDVIPYKFSITHTDLDSGEVRSESFRLIAYEIKDSEDYSMPSDLGKGLVYTWNGIHHGKEVSGTFTLKSVAEGSLSGTDVKFVSCCFSGTRDGVDSIFEAILPPLTYVNEVGFSGSVPNGDFRLENALSFLVHNILFGYMPVRSEVISTIDGNVVCDVYEKKTQSFSSTYDQEMYVGQSNGLIYSFKDVYYYEVLISDSEITLTSHISP